MWNPGLFRLLGLGPRNSRTQFNRNSASCCAALALQNMTPSHFVLNASPYKAVGCFVFSLCVLAVYGVYQGHSQPLYHGRSGWDADAQPFFWGSPDSAPCSRCSQKRLISLALGAGGVHMCLLRNVAMLRM